MPPCEVVEFAGCRAEFSPAVQFVVALHLFAHLLHAVLHGAVVVAFDGDAALAQSGQGVESAGEVFGAA